MALLQCIEWDLEVNETDTVMIICFLRRIADPLQMIVNTHLILEERRSGWRWCFWTLRVA